MKHLSPPSTPIDVCRNFPGLNTGAGEPWHYLDSAATAQKPTAVIEAMSMAMGQHYASVHRGVYSRSANMTLAYEAARKRVADFIGASENEVVFARGATEAINLIAMTWGLSQLSRGDRIVISQLEHHSNIVPWQMLAKKIGIYIDVCPLTPTGSIDLDALEKILTERHKLVSLAHVSNVLGSVLEVERATQLAHGVGAKLLLDGCQAAPRLRVDVAAMGCDFYVFSAHKLYGPTGIGCLWAKDEILTAMPPYQGGGAMIDKVTFEETTYAPAPQRFEAGTPAVVEAVALDAAVQFTDRIGLDVIAALENDLVTHLRDELKKLKDITVYGPASSAGIVSFNLEGIHPHDLGTILDESNVAIRAGHHCAQPLMKYLGVSATARASFGVYSDHNDVEALLDGILRTRRIFG